MNSNNHEYGRVFFKRVAFRIFKVNTIIQARIECLRFITLSSSPCVYSVERPKNTGIWYRHSENLPRYLSSCSLQLSKLSFQHYIRTSPALIPQLNSELEYAAMFCTNSPRRIDHLQIWDWGPYVHSVIDCSAFS